MIADAIIIIIIVNASIMIIDQIVSIFIAILSISQKICILICIVKLFVYI